MPSHDIMDNRHEKLVDHINRILSSTEAARFAVGHFFLSGLESIAERLAGEKEGWSRLTRSLREVILDSFTAALQPSPLESLNQCLPILYPAFRSPFPHFQGAIPPCPL